MNATQMYLFPEVTVQIVNTLYILGNGFDLYHNLKTRYVDFKQFASVLQTLEPFFCLDELWCNFEEALGSCDVDTVYSYVTSDKEIDYDHMMRSTIIIEDSPDEEFTPILDYVRKLFSEWIASIDLRETKIKDRFSCLCPESKYITFNYTRVLEEVYKIKSDSILHIHGEVEKPESIIVGHTTHYEVGDYSDYMSLLSYELNARTKIVDSLNLFEKPTAKIINENFAFFKSLSKISTVLVFGHSYSSIDFPYFLEVKKCTSLDVKWYFHVYSNEDCVRLGNLIKFLEIPKENYKVVAI